MRPIAIPAMLRTNDGSKEPYTGMGRTRFSALGPNASTPRSLPGRLVHEIGAKIVSGALAPGTVLPNESEWGAQLGVSRTVLREATKLLISKGLVESRPKTGTRVREQAFWKLLDADVLSWHLSAAPLDRFVRELFELRRVVEPAVAALAASRRSPQQIEELEAAYQGMLAAGSDNHRFIEPDTRFHHTILNAVDNGLLRALGVVVETALALTLRLSLDNPRGQSHSVPLHRAVLDAIRAGDAKTAEKAMRKLIDDAESDVTSALKIASAGTARPKRKVRK
jgi:DNA-binding FadR family transcriptional regulator